MLTKSKQRVKFSPNCELLIFNSSVISLDSDESDHTEDGSTASGESSSQQTQTTRQASSSSSPNMPTPTPPNTQQQQQHYRLGNTLRSPADMVQFHALEDKIQSIYALQISEFAWVKRKSGDWTFCQLVERTTNNDNGEHVLTFSVSEMGHRKSMRPSRWVHMVRTCAKHVFSSYFKNFIDALASHRRSHAVAVLEEEACSSRRRVLR